MLLGPKLSACVVLYHQGPEVLTAIQCVEKSTVASRLFVVDNSPGDGGAERIHTLFPEAEIVSEPGNVGFARAHNAVLDRMQSRYHLIFNPDVEFAPDLLERMIAYMDAHPDIAILTPRVLNTDGTEQFLPKREPTVRYLLGGPLAVRGQLLWDKAARLRERANQHRAAAALRNRAGRLLQSEEQAATVQHEGRRAKIKAKGKSMARSFCIAVMERTATLMEKRPTFTRLCAVLVDRLSERMKRPRREYTLEDNPPQEPTEVSFATGCFLLIRSQLFYRLHGFDERFFLYHEDSDLSRRALREGKIVYHPEMTVVHHWERASSHDRHSRMLHVQSTFKYFRKWGWRW